MASVANKFSELDEEHAEELAQTHPFWKLLRRLSSEPQLDSEHVNSFFFTNRITSMCDINFADSDLYIRDSDHEHDDSVKALFLLEAEDAELRAHFVTQLEDELVSFCTKGRPFHLDVEEIRTRIDGSSRSRIYYGRRVYDYDEIRRQSNLASGNGPSFVDTLWAVVGKVASNDMSLAVWLRLTSIIDIIQRMAKKQRYFSPIWPSELERELDELTKLHTLAVVNQFDKLSGAHAKQLAQTHSFWDQLLRLRNARRHLQQSNNAEQRIEATTMIKDMFDKDNTFLIGRFWRSDLGRALVDEMIDLVWVRVETITTNAVEGTDESGSQTPELRAMLNCVDHMLMKLKSDKVIASLKAKMESWRADAHHSLLRAEQMTVSSMFIANRSLHSATPTVRQRAAEMVIEWCRADLLKQLVDEELYAAFTLLLRAVELLVTNDEAVDFPRLQALLTAIDHVTDRLLKCRDNAAHLSAGAISKLKALLSDNHFDAEFMSVHPVRLTSVLIANCALHSEHEQKRLRAAMWCAAEITKVDASSLNFFAKGMLHRLHEVDMAQAFAVLCPGSSTAFPLSLRRHIPTDDRARDMLRRKEAVVVLQSMRVMAARDAHDAKLSKLCCHFMRKIQKINRGGFVMPALLETLEPIAWHKGRLLVDG